MSSIVIVSQPGGMFSPKDPLGSEFFYWDFTAILKPGETIVSAVVIATSLVDGSDNSASMVDGDALVMNGLVVRQMIAAGTSGVPYRMTAVATTTLQTLPLSGILPIGPEYGVVS